jgi:hypothetical protein
VVTAIVGVAIFVLIIALVIAVARDPGPPPHDVAVAYERAWDHLDFDSLWSLSGDELRDGMGRKPFIDAKRAAYARQADLGGLADSVSVERFETGDQVAVVHTLVALRDGGAAHNEMQLEQRAGRWVVVSYRILGSDASSASSP